MLIEPSDIVALMKVNAAQNGGKLHAENFAAMLAREINALHRNTMAGGFTMSDAAPVRERVREQLREKLAHIGKLHIDDLQRSEPGGVIRVAEQPYAVAGGAPHRTVIEADTVDVLDRGIADDEFIYRG